MRALDKLSLNRQTDEQTFAFLEDLTEPKMNDRRVELKGAGRRQVKGMRE